MNQERFRGAAAALLALSLATGVSAQPKGEKPGASAAVPMPKTVRITLSEIKQLVTANNVVIIDVRSADAYAAGHIPGALSMPEESLTPATAEKLKRMGKPIATYCA
jgi:3-mercaptopyruvate sulfurtransferase SseA